MESSGSLRAATNSSLAKRSVRRWSKMQRMSCNSRSFAVAQFITETGRSANRSIGRGPSCFVVRHGSRAAPRATRLKLGITVLFFALTPWPFGFAKRHRHLNSTRLHAAVPDRWDLPRRSDTALLITVKASAGNIPAA